MTDKERIERLELVLSTLINWLALELGNKGVNDLLEMMNEENQARKL